MRSFVFHVIGTHPCTLPKDLDTMDDLAQMAASTRCNRLCTSITCRLHLKQFARFSCEQYVHRQGFFNVTAAPRRLETLCCSILSITTVG